MVDHRVQHGFVAVLTSAILSLMGCSPTSPDPVIAQTKRPPIDARRSLNHVAKPIEFDFGRVVLHGKPLRHEFTLVNPTNQPMRILSVDALTPCCSEAGDLPRLIGPKGQARLAVWFSPTTTAGRKQAAFVVRTDREECPIFTLVIKGSLYPDVEIAQKLDSDDSLVLGKPGRQELLVTCRTDGTGGRSAPHTVHASPPLSASFIGKIDEARTADGFTQTARRITVALPASARVGNQRGEIELRWPAGEAIQHTVQWKVVPAVRAVPSSFISQASSGNVTREFVIRSNDLPFRVTKVRGDVLADVVTSLPTAPGRSHTLRLSVNLEKATPTGATDIVIDIDHAYQHSVCISLIVMPASQGGAE